MNGRVDVAALKAQVPLAELVGRRVELKLRRQGEWIGRCPFHQDKTPSFKVDGRGFYKCFGCDAKGDHLSWLEQAEGLDFAAAVKVLEDLAGGRAPRLTGPSRLSPALQRGPDPEEAIERKAAALEIWHAAKPAAGTDVARYLASRGIRLAPPVTLRWHPGLWHPDVRAKLPAMIGAMTNVDRRIVAVHRTFLAVGGRAKADVTRAKMMLGVAGGAAIRLAEVGPDGMLGIAEGIETALSVMQMRPGLPVWAAGSLGAIAGAGLGGDHGPPHPTRPGARLPTEVPDLDRPGVVLPPYVRHVVILPDADGDRPSQAAMIERSIRRWQRDGRRVSVAWPSAGGDWNDELQRALARAA